MSGDEGTQVPPPPVTADDHPSPPPPQRGWYRDPANPNYERFWDGQKWSTRRYWGGAAMSDSSAGGGVPMPAPTRPMPASRFAPVQYRGLTGVPFNPRSPTRQILVACIGIGLAVTYVSLHVFPWRVLAVLFAIGVVATLLTLPARLRFLRDPARQAAIREPITFESRVWLRFTFAPTHWGYPLINRWDFAVRTDSFQVTNWIWGQRDRARTTFFHAADCTMWQARVDGRDCIVVSGPTYRRSTVEFAFTAMDIDNSQAWAALAAAGVRPAEAGERAAPASMPVSAPKDTATTGFQRIGHDLGSRTPAAASPPPTPAGGEAANPAQATSNPRLGLRPPIPARRIAPVALVGLVALVFLMPVLFALVVRSFTVGSLSDDHVTTAQCALNAARTEVEWSGDLNANARYAIGEVLVEIRDAAGVIVGRADAAIRADEVRNRPTPAGPVAIPVAGAPAVVNCVTLVQTGR